MFGLSCLENIEASPERVPSEGDGCSPSKYPGNFDLLLRIRPAKTNELTKMIPLPTDKQTTAIMSLATTTKITATGMRKPADLYARLCSGCHGTHLEGKEKIPSLVDRQWLNGGSIAAIKQSIAQGVTSKGMPAWEGVLSPADIINMTNYILAHKMK